MEVRYNSFMSTVSYPHIEVRSDGKAYIAGTGFKVRMLVEAYLANGADIAALKRGHPHLSPSQIYGALTYYHDHEEEIAREIDQLNRVAEQFKAEQGESLLVKKLREQNREAP